MNSQLITHIQNLAAGRAAWSGEKQFPEIRTGMQVEVSQRITEWDKSRVQKFEGVVIRTSGKTHGEKTYTVRRVSGGLGIEKTFPVACPTVENVTVIRQYKVNRKNIRYIRELEGKSARLKEVKAKNALLKSAPKKAKKTPKTEAAE